MNKVFKAKICKICINKFTPLRPFQKTCSIKCAIDLVKKDNEKQEDLGWKERKKELKEKLKTLSFYKNEARVEFQKWIRLRDKDLPCISCGKLSENYDAGHYFKAELYSGLIFHEDNCHKQCVYCNQRLHGNEANYRIGLVKKIGEERVVILEKIKDIYRTYKFTKDELIQIKVKYKQKLKQ